MEETLGAIASALAHEIRNGLNAISLHAQYVERVLRSERIERRPEVERGLHGIALEVARLRDAAEGVRELYRPLALDLRPVDVAEPVGGALAPVRSECAEKGVEFTETLEPAMALADRDAVRRLADCLCRHALDALERGGRLSVATARDGGDARIEVRDTGRGLDEAALARAFEPFSPGGRSRLGVGLALAQRIAAAHGGRIALASEPGGWTTCTVWLRRGGRSEPC